MSKSLYLLAQFDEETQSIFADYYKILYNNGFIGNQTKNIPYHFTLGDKAVEYEESLKNEMEIICSDTSEIVFRFDHIGLFGLNVLFLEPNMNFEILQLQKRFFNHCGNGYHLWTAHATILLDEPDVIVRALPVLARNFKPFSAKIESIGLYEFFPTRFIKRCELLLNK